MQGSFISISEGYLSYENRHQNERFQVSIKKLPKQNLVEILIFSIRAEVVCYRFCSEKTNLGIFDLNRRRFLGKIRIRSLLLRN